MTESCVEEQKTKERKKTSGLLKCTMGDKKAKSSRVERSVNIVSLNH